MERVLGENQGRNQNCPCDNFKIITLILLLVFCIDIQGQSPAQADLLNKAYSKHSKSLLYNFFDNWFDEISSNENESSNKNQSWNQSWGL